MTTKEPKDVSNGCAPSKAPLKKPVRPDFTARDEKIQKLRAKVQEFDAEAKKKASEIDVLVNEARASNKLETMKRDLANIVHNKVQLEKVQANARKHLNELRNPKSNKGAGGKPIDIGISNEDIKERMEQLTAKVVEEQDPADRDRIIAHIQGLNSAWNDLKGASSSEVVETNGRTGKDLASSLEDELSRCSSKLQEVQRQEREQRDAIEDLREKTSASQPAIDRLRSERDVCLTVVRSLLDTIRSVNEEYSLMFDKYKEDIKEFNAQRDVIMSERRAEREAEQKAREEQRAKRELESKGPPFCAEILGCEQLQRWCKQFERSSAKEVAPAAASAPDLDGLVPLKKTECEDDVLTTSRTKNKKKGGKASQKNGSSDSSNKKLMLDIEILSLLAKLKLPIPATVSDLPSLVKQLEGKKAEFEDKQKRALAGEKIAEEEAPKNGDGPGTSGVSNDSEAVAVSMRCDEAFGQVILEIAAN